MERFHQDHFASIKNINKLRDSAVRGKKHIPQISTWQCYCNQVIGKTKFGKITELCMGPPHWCSKLGHQYGHQNFLREERKILLPKSSVALWNTNSYHF